MNLPRINPQDLNPEDKNRRWKRKDARGSFVDTYWRQGSSKIAKHSEYRDDSRSMRTNSIFESPSIRLGRWRKRHDNTDLSAGGQLTDAILIIVHELINRYLSVDRQQCLYELSFLPIFRTIEMMLKEKRREKK